MSDRQTNTMAEGLQKLLSDISAMMAAPDADLDFLGQLQTVVLQKIRAPLDQAAAIQNQVQQQQAGQGGAPGPNQQPPPQPQQQFGPANVPGLRNGPPVPNADELRRVLAANGPGGLR
jgi:hypothetical protein